RKYSSTAFLSHWFTCQPCSPRPGSATRKWPDSKPAMACSTAGRTLPSISSGMRLARRSNEDSEMCRMQAMLSGSGEKSMADMQGSVNQWEGVADTRDRHGWGGGRRLTGAVAVQAGQQRLAQRLPARLVQRPVAFVGEAEDVFDPLAEGRNARIVHPQPLSAQHVGHVGQQAGPVGAD